MQVKLDIPEDIGQAIASAGPVDRTALEGLAAEAYRSGSIGEQQLRRLLGLASRFAVHEWLAQREIPLNYTEADLQSDLGALSDLGLR